MLGFATSMITILVVVALFWAAVAETRKPAVSEAGGPVELTYVLVLKHWFFWIFGVLFTLACVGFAGFLAIRQESSAWWWFAGLAVVWVFVTIAIFYESRIIVRLHDDHVERRTPRGDHRRMRWEDINDIESSFMWNSFFLIDDQGRRLRVPWFLRGLVEFESRCQAVLGVEKAGPAFTKFRKCFPF